MSHWKSRSVPAELLHFECANARRNSDGADEKQKRDRNDSAYTEQRSGPV